LIWMIWGWTTMTNGVSLAPQTINDEIFYM
jgi:hypothetical protein